MKIFLIFLCLFNILMWIVFLKKFKALFTADDILESTKEKMNRIISDMNRNVDRDITVVNDVISRLDSARNDAEKAMKLMSEMEKKSVALSEFKSKVSARTEKLSPYSAKVEKSYEKHKSRVSLDRKNVSDRQTVSITQEGERQIGKEPLQNTLFDERAAPINTVAEVSVMEDGASYAEIPVVVPEVFVSDTPVVTHSKEDLKTRIIRMYDLGYSPDDIVHQLDCSMTEVQFVLTLENRI